jgi:hypothetical protein
MSIIPKQERTKARLRVSLKRKIKALDQNIGDIKDWTTDSLLMVYKYLKHIKGV